MFTGVLATANAQNTPSGSASQQMQLSMADVLSISLENASPTVNLNFSSVNDYANGITSGVQTLKVMTNESFRVSVKTSSDKFSYNGNISPSPNMPVNNTLFMKIVNNNTGGQVKSGFANFKTLRKGNKNLLRNCEPGAAQTFDIQYQAKPGFEYPEGSYTINVVFTATKS